MANPYRCRSSAKRSLVLLAPERAELHSFQGEVSQSTNQHRELIARIQRLRGSIYAEDGAISRSLLTPDGRHVNPVDDASWHLVTLNDQGAVLGCIRFRRHSPQVNFSDLCLLDSALARCATWGKKLRASVADDVRAARGGRALLY